MANLTEAQLNAAYIAIISRTRPATLSARERTGIQTLGLSNNGKGSWCVSKYEDRGKGKTMKLITLSDWTTLDNALDLLNSYHA